MSKSTLYELPISVPSAIYGWAGDNATPGGGNELPVFYPATGEQIAILIEDDASSVDVAVTAARRAFDQGPWPKLSIAERISVLESCSKVILDNADELARLECAAT